MEATATKGRGGEALAAAIPEQGQAAEHVLETMRRLRAQLPGGFAAAEGSWRRLLASEPGGAQREELLVGTGCAFVREHGDLLRDANEIGGFPMAAFVGIEVSTVLAAYAGWRLGKGVYLYDPTVFGALWGTPLNGEVPVEALHRLPEYCPYVAVPDLLENAEEPGLLDGLRGFLAFIEPRRANRAAHLVLVPARV